MPKQGTPNAIVTSGWNQGLTGESISGFIAAFSVDSISLLCFLIITLLMISYYLFA